MYHGNSVGGCSGGDAGGVIGLSGSGAMQLNHQQNPRNCQYLRQGYNSAKQNESHRNRRRGRSCPHFAFTAVHDGGLQGDEIDQGRFVEIDS